jgi:hypothetical protein
MPRSVMVAPEILDLFVKVRILARQPRHVKDLRSHVASPNERSLYAVRQTSRANRVSEAFTRRRSGVRRRKAAREFFPLHRRASFFFPVAHSRLFVRPGSATKLEQGASDHGKQQDSLHVLEARFFPKAAQSSPVSPAETADEFGALLREDATRAEPEWKAFPSPAARDSSAGARSHR